MKKIHLLFTLIPLFFSCNDSGVSNNNPFVPNYTFSMDLNMNLPTYFNLKFVSNAVYVPNIGARGVIVFNTASGYNAFDAACPNQALSDCSTMSINGINAVCGCDNVTYSLFTGQSNLQYPMKQYRVQVNGDILRVFN
ncbi:hypothetical protein [Flavobacterium sp. I-STPA6A]|uniref:Rieske (2Fe-2S) protein n=1 Tax=Flavobacterium sp. I-STPA6A TaxID=2590450 RepID=UPI00131E3606|nr:hypothetical protein [Flavobacterium sp. I-STPA6A]